MCVCVLKFREKERIRTEIERDEDPFEVDVFDS